MIISVCIGSACHLKGSYNVINTLQELIETQELGDKVEIKAAFCLGSCQEAVSVKINEEDKVHSVSTKNAKSFFDEFVLPRI